MAQNISPEERSLLLEIKQKQAQINQIFRELEIKKQDIINPKESKQQKNSHDSEFVNKGEYFNKYNKYNIQQIKRNYTQAMSGTKWMQLPYCRKIIYQKLIFCFPMSILTTLVAILWYNRHQKKLALNIRNFGKVYAGITILSMALVFGESILTQPYCDISSHHYNTSIGNRAIAKLSKDQFIKLAKIKNMKQLSKFKSQDSV